jgi:hypothetical protein
MKFVMPIWIGAAVATIVTTPVVIHAQAIQDLSATTYHSGPWQPVAHINPNLPVKIEVINETELPLQYGLTTDTSHSLAPSSKTTLNNVPLAANLLINSSISSTSLKYHIEVIDNVVTIRVREIISDAPENHAINIQKNGGIYIY